MPLPNQDDLNSLEASYLGSPFANCANSSIDTTSLDSTYKGKPFLAVNSAPVLISLPGF